MSQDFNNSFDNLLEQILANKEGTDLDLCIKYLRSTHQKYLFAKQRFTSLKRKISKYKQKYIVEHYNTYAIKVWPVGVNP